VALRATESGAGHDALVAVIGHGTPAHSRSADTTVAIAETLRSRGRFRDVVPVFLDQEPSIATLAVQEPPVVAVPLFVADGWHAGVQVPGIAGEAVPEGLVYAAPAGLHPAVTDIIVALALEAGACR
jgi:sirohydrochlorin ferrochelatase